MVLLVLKSTPKARIAVPMAASRAIDELVQRLHGTLVRTQGLYTALLEKAAQEPRLDFVGELKGGYVFPAFQPAFDAMMASAKLLELLAKSQTPLSELVDEIPSTYLIRRCVPCSWEHKGMMMRKVMEDAKGQIVELIEGVKIWQGKSWVMITPDPDKPVIHILAEGHHQAESEQLAARYEEKLHEWLNAAGHHATLAVGG
jgi:mannose-1-phosphate guanylyltransferase/phosphomannomutase